MVACTVGPVYMNPANWILNLHRFKSAHQSGYIPIQSHDSFNPIFSDYHSIEGVSDSGFNEGNPKESIIIHLEPGAQPYSLFKKCSY